MKKILLLATVILFFLSSFSQVYSQSKSKGRENSLKEGNWALMFGIDQNFRLTSLNGFTLSIKKHMSDAHALRLGLSVSYENTDENYADGPDSLKSPSTSKKNSYSIAMYPSYYFYIAPKADVNFYIGVGAFGKYSHGTEDNFDYYEPEPIRHRQDYSKTESFSYGVNTNLGVEFFPIKSFSIFAEYSIEFGYLKAQSNWDRFITSADGTLHERTDGTTKKFSLNNQGVAFGLCVYF